MNLRENSCDNMDRVHLAQNRDYLHVLVKTEVNLRIQ
jgi:hypothetical protein